VPLDQDDLHRIEAALAWPEHQEPRLQRRHAIFRLSRAPALRAVSHAFAVVGPASRRPDSRPLVREVRLDRRAIDQGVDGGLRIRDAEVTVEQVDGWVRELRAIRIPLGGVERNMGLDGTTFTLSTEAGLAAASLRWWWDGPPAWSELTGWARRMMRMLHRCTSPEEAGAEYG
jgi:hypothetical protein